jgi:hypothetical protein
MFLKQMVGMCDKPAAAAAAAQNTDSGSGGIIDVGPDSSVEETDA